jgi:hypothetical protein
MFTRKTMPKMIPVLLIVTFLLMGVLPTQAEPFANQVNSSGDLLWAKGMGGTGYDRGNAITVDSNGNVYTTGKFLGTADFDPGEGEFNLTSAGSNDDVFVSKLDSSGNFVWAKRMGGYSDDEGCGIAVDSTGNVYTVGIHEGGDFDPGTGTFTLGTSGGYDIFVSKLDSNGDFVWAKGWGGWNGDAGYGIALDSSGNIYTTGYFRNTADFDPGAGVFNLVTPGNTSEPDVFVSKLDNSGNFVWAKQLGGTGDYYGDSDEGHGIAVDTSGNVYTTGFFVGTADFDPGAGTFDLTSAGGLDIFVSKLDSNGDFVWAKRIAGTGTYDEGHGIALDSNGNVYTTGYFRDTADFDPGAGTFNLSSAGLGDIFISKLDSSGGFIWARNMGGADGDEGKSITLDSKGNVYTTGFFNGTADFDPGPGIFDLTSARIFVSKLDSNGDFIWAKNMGGVSYYDVGFSIVTDASGNVHTTGSYWGTADFDPSGGIFNLTSAGNSDVFVSKLENNVVVHIVYLPQVLKDIP